MSTGFSGTPFDKILTNLLKNFRSEDIPLNGFFPDSPDRRLFGCFFPVIRILRLIQLELAPQRVNICLCEAHMNKFTCFQLRLSPQGRFRRPDSLTCGYTICLAPDTDRLSVTTQKAVRSVPACVMRSSRSHALTRTSRPGLHTHMSFCAVLQGLLPPARTTPSPAWVLSVL